MEKHHSRRLAGLALASGLLALAPAAASAATHVNVRVEGTKKTLVKQVDVTTSKNRTVGLPGQGTCKGTSALAALDAASGGAWSGSYNASFGDYLLNSIGGEKHPASSSGADFYSVWINHRSAQAGLCGLTPKRGDELLIFPSRFPEPKGGILPLGLTAPRHARAGKAFSVRVVQYSEAGKRSNVRGAIVKGGGVRAKTDRRGVARFTLRHGRAITLQATKPGRVRSETETVDVR